MLLPDMCDNFMDWFGVPGKSKHNELAVVGSRLVGAFTPPFPKFAAAGLPTSCARWSPACVTVGYVYIFQQRNWHSYTMMWLLHWLVYISSISVLRYCVGGIEALERLSIVVVVTERLRIWRDWRWHLRRRLCGRVWVSLHWRTVSCISLKGKTQLMFVRWYHVLPYKRHLQLLKNACLI